MKEDNSIEGVDLLKRLIASDDLERIDDQNFKDGEYIEVPVKQNTWEVANFSKAPMRSYCQGAEIPLITPAGTVETYRKVGIALCEMMVIGCLTVGEVIPKLMEHYSPEVKS